MLTKSNYTVEFPLEHFIEWMTFRALIDGIISDNSHISVSDISFDSANQYVVVEGMINTVVNS
jgi:hypothetical protein